VQSERNADVAVLSTHALHQAANFALTLGDYLTARQYLFSYQQLLDRAAQTDTQQEEYDIFLKLSEQLDQELSKLMQASRSKKGSNELTDTATKVLYEMRALPKQQCLAGVRKDISSRKVGNPLSSFLPPLLFSSLLFSPLLFLSSHSQLIILTLLSYIAVNS
jgi:hypothetical protein